MYITRQTHDNCPRPECESLLRALSGLHKRLTTAAFRTSRTVNHRSANPRSHFRADHILADVDHHNLDIHPNPADDPIVSAGPMATAETIASYLQSQGLYAKPQWLESYTSTTRPNTPQAALQKTALFRLLASDFCDTLDTSRPSSALPVGIDDPSLQQRHVHGATIPVQILDIQDIGRSRWSQVELLEQYERGETTKGRELIRLVPDAEDGASGTTTTTTTTAARAEQTASKGPHKLLLQDCRGTKVYGFELASVQGLGLQTSIGCKLLLREPVVARGVVMLEPSRVTVLGGKIEAWDTAWRRARKEALQAGAQASTTG